MIGYNLDVRKPVELVINVLDLFSDDMYLSLEGRLTHQDFSKVEGVVTHPTHVLKRNTLQPRLDFVILPVNKSTKEVIKRVILHQVGLRSNVIHLLLEKNAVLVFAAYDQFYPDSVWITSEVPEDWLLRLQQHKVLRSFEKVGQ